MTASAGRSTENDRGSLPFGPGLVVVILGLLLVAVVAAGVWLNHRDRTPAESVVTIAALRADPTRYDNQIVHIEGQVEDVREAPFLSQYALYTLRDETGSMRVLTQHGAPPTGAPTRLVATYHASVTLDDELRAIIQDRLGAAAGELTRLLPGIPLNVVFLEQERYEPTSSRRSPAPLRLFATQQHASASSIRYVASRNDDRTVHPVAFRIGLAGGSSALVTVEGR